MITIKGTKAKTYYQKVLDNHTETGIYSNLKKGEGIIGGLWEENGIWVAFDATCDFTIEEFANESEAIKYANGEESITRGGYTI